MADRSGAERETGDTAELLYTDLTDSSRVDSPPLRLDHCDLLLDAIDAQLGQLQIRPRKHEATPGDCDCSKAAPLVWSRQSLSKDTGLGSTSQTNDTPMSRLDLMGALTVERTSEETEQELDGRTRGDEDAESQREQVMWRLGRLLGDACDEAKLAGEAQRPSDSVCTEDFVRRFRDEMVDLVWPESDCQLRGKEEEAERTEVSDCDSVQRALSGDRRGATVKSRSDTETCSNQQRKQLEKRLSEVNTSHGGERAAAGEEGSTSHTTQGENLQQSSSRPPKTRRLAGVPVRSFDAVSIDSDLDSVCTEQVRQHLHRRPGWSSLIQSVTAMGDSCTNHSDSDAPSKGGREPRPTAGRRSSYGDVQNRSPSVRKAPRNKKETYRLVADTDGDTDEEELHCCRAERTSGRLQSIRMKERLSALRRKCEKEEETLRLKRIQLEDVEFSLTELHQSRKHAVQELERLTAETAKMEKQRRTLEFVLRGSRAGRDSGDDLTAQSHREHTPMEKPGAAMSALEREELDRQLQGAKAELFAEQRRAREKLESMEEKLEETQEELRRVTEAEGVLRSRCCCLEDRLRHQQDQTAGELEERNIRLGTLEKSLAQRELQLLGSQQHRGALRAERDELKRELQHQEARHSKAATEAQQRMAAALKRQKKDLSSAHEQQIQKFKLQTEEATAKALNEQAASLTQHIESLKSSIQLKEEEARRLRDSLLQQTEEAQNREEELRVEALEKAHKAMDEQRRRWEAEKQEAVQVHCGMLEQHRERLSSELQRETSKAAALQTKVVELTTRVEELERDGCAQQRQQESLLAAVCRSLKEEHQAELQELQRQMTQESEAAALRLRQAVRLAESEAGRLRLLLEEREGRQEQVTAELQQLRLWAQEVGAELQQLHVLVEPAGARLRPVQLPPSPAAPEALTHLRTFREQVKHVIGRLHQELDSLKQTAEQLREDKERELSIQRQQLRTERDQALDSLKERLIQEHVEELSSLRWTHSCDGAAEGGGAAASLRRQLRAKDGELRQVQSSLARWKEQTAARLARKFEEELTAELERCRTELLLGRKTAGRQRKPEGPRGERSAQEPPCSPSLHLAASHSPSDVASLKLLRYLQSRVKQLRAENQAHSWSPSHLSESCLTTITQHQDLAGTPSDSSVSS